MAIQRLLMDAGAEGVDQNLVMVDPQGLEVPADWRFVQSPETYVGYGQASGFANEDPGAFDRPQVYAAASVGLNEWFLKGQWTVARNAGVAQRAWRRDQFPIPRP